MSLQAFLVFLAVLAGISYPTDGSHFRGGIISWKPIESGSQFEVAFTFRLAFRRTFSGYYCNQYTVNSNGIIGASGSWKAQCIGSYYYCSSRNVGSVGYRCTDFSTIEDWSQGENSFNYTFSSAGPWRIWYSSCCWISLNLGGSSWYLSSTVNLTRRSDTGKINSSPVSASSPIVRLQQGCQKIVKIPTEDADGDKVRCRWANVSSECGGVCKMFKYGILDEEHCSLTYQGTGATGWYAVAIMLEDYPKSTTNFNAVSPFSSIGLQFLVNIISYSGSCYRKPYFTGSTPAADSCIEINTGSTYRASIAVKHVDSARRVVEINVVAPTGVRTTAVNSTIDQYGETVYSRNLEWTPTSSQRDQNIICFTAVDNLRIESEKRCITILVTGLYRSSPMAILSSRSPSSVVYANYYYYYYYQFTYTYWRITFDRSIKKPKNPSFIRVVINGTTIFKLDASSSPEVYVSGNNNTILNFRIQNNVLSMTGTYSIILDPGSVVGIGCSSDGPPTPGVNAPDLWRVYVYGYCPSGFYRNPLGPGYCVDVNECVNPSSRYRRSLLAADSFKESAATRSGRQKRNIYYYSSPSPTMSNVSSSSENNPSQVLLSLQPTPTQQTLAPSLTVGPGYQGCYKNFTSSSGNIYSPNYPRNYGPNQDCVWNITLSYGYVRLYFYNFSVESCPFDHLDVIDGWSLDHQQIGRYCGNNRPPTYIYSSGRHLILRFRSDHIIHYSGFHIYYSNVSNVNNASECYNYTSIMDVTRSVFYRSSVVCDSGLIEGWYRFEGVGGNQIPETCPLQRSCGTHAPGWLNGIHPFVHQGIVNRSICYHWINNCCHWKNNVLVRNCGNYFVYRLERPPVCHLRYCTDPGNSSSQVLPSLQPTPTQQTTAISSTVGPGYQGCYQHFTSYSGYISSPNNPWNYGPNQDCVWNITLPYGYVRLYFYSFSVESCPHDYLDVINGWSLHHQRIDRYCGTKRPPTYIYSSGRHLVLHFRSDHSVQYSGFRIYYSTVYSVPSSALYNYESLSTQMSISPTSVQASRHISSSAYIHFVLHLPANCEQTCLNTYGSFYCRCYDGYTLNADRKTCSDIDECQNNNGGCSHHCNNIPGSFYCSCLEGQTISSDNKTCTEPGIEVTCGEEFMQVDLERANFRNFDPSYLHLNYRFCRATANSTHISLRTTLNGCGTTFNETNDEIRFDNVVKAEKIIVQGVVTRSFDVNIRFYCKYSKSKLVHVSFKPFGIVTGSQGGFGNFTFKMELFKSNAYRYPYTAEEYPISVQMNQLIYIQYSVESFQSQLFAFADTCRATTSRDPYSSPQYVFLRNGCPEDSTISFNYSPGPVQRLSLRAFDFLADYPIVYLHCQVLACHKQTVGSRCSRGCQRYIRKKRELTNQETENEQQKETETYNINTGGFLIVNERKESSDADKLKSVVVSSVSSVGGVLLIVVVVLSVVIIKKGFIKKFNRRNKVDDIYGREQQTNTNAYVNEASAEFEGEGDTAPGRELETRDSGFLVREDIFLDGNKHRTESGC